MKIKVVQDIGNVTSWEDLRRFSSQSINLITVVINGGIDLVDNCATVLADVTFANGNSEVEVKHSLGKVPSGYLIAGKSSSFDIYNGPTPNTNQAIYIKGTAAGSASILIF